MASVLISMIDRIAMIFRKVICSQGWRCCTETMRKRPHAALLPNRVTVLYADCFRGGEDKKGPVCYPTSLLYSVLIDRRCWCCRRGKIARQMLE